MPERPIWERSFDRKGFVAISAMTAFLAACGGDDESSSGTTTEGTAAKASGTLHYYNWADYVNPKTYPAFTKATGVKIKKDFFVSNEDLQAKLQGGARGYDLAAPTGYMVAILADAGLLEKIDWSKLPDGREEHRPQVQEPAVRQERRVVGRQGLGHDGLRLPDRSREGEADLVARLLRPDQGAVLEEGDHSGWRARGDRVDARDARPLVQLGGRGRAEPGEGGAAEAEAAHPRHHLDRVQADAHRRPGRRWRWAGTATAPLSPRRSRRTTSSRRKAASSGSTRT